MGFPDLACLLNYWKHTLVERIRFPRANNEYGLRQTAPIEKTGRYPTGFI